VPVIIEWLSERTRDYYSLRLLRHYYQVATIIRVDEIKGKVRER
jgi:hypothetical protein